MTWPRARPVSPRQPQASFTVTGQIQACGASCSASQSTATTATSITTSSASGNFAALGLGGVSLTCNHYKAVSDVGIFGVFNSAGGAVASASATATLTISASAVESSPRPLLLWQVCYASPTPFPSIPGTSGTTVIGGTTYHTGLLLPCVLFPPGQDAALPHLPAQNGDGRSPADLCRARGSLLRTGDRARDLGSVTGDRSVDRRPERADRPTS